MLIRYVLAAAFLLVALPGSAQTSGIIRPSNFVTQDGCFGYLCKKTITLTDAQIKALPTTPVLAIAGEASKKILLTRWHISTNFVAAYTNNQNQGSPNQAPVELYSIINPAATLEFPNSIIVSSILTPFINTADNVVNSGVLHYEGYRGTVTSPRVDNIALYIWCDTNTDDMSAPLGNFTGGNAANTMTIVIYYLKVAV